MFRARDLRGVGAVVVAALAPMSLASCGGAGAPSASASAGTTVPTSAAGLTTTSALAATASTSAATGPKAQSAADEVKRLLSYIDKGQFDREWDDLYPAQQGFVAKDLYMHCATTSLSGISIDAVKVIETYQAAVSIPGTNLPDQNSTAVTVDITATRLGTQRSEKNTFHMFNVDGRWRWTLEDPTAYKSGRCP